MQLVRPGLGAVFGGAAEEPRDVVQRGVFGVTGVLAVIVA
jgi:hypothetical protein